MDTEKNEAVREGDKSESVDAGGKKSSDGIKLDKYIEKYWLPMFKCPAQ